MTPSGPTGTIVLAALVGIAGAVVVVVFDSVVADVVGVVALACGLSATIWSSLRWAGDPGPSS